MSLHSYSSHRQTSLDSRVAEVYLLDDRVVWTRPSASTSTTTHALSFQPYIKTTTTSTRRTARTPVRGQFSETLHAPDAAEVVQRSPTVALQSQLQPVITTLTTATETRTCRHAITIYDDGSTDVYYTEDVVEVVTTQATVAHASEAAVPKPAARPSNHIEVTPHARVDSWRRTPLQPMSDVHGPCACEGFRPYIPPRDTCAPEAMDSKLRDHDDAALPLARLALRPQGIPLKIAVVDLEWNGDNKFHQFAAVTLERSKEGNLTIVNRIAFVASDVAWQAPRTSKKAHWCTHEPSDMLLDQEMVIKTMPSELVPQRAKELIDELSEHPGGIVFMSWGSASDKSKLGLADLPVESDDPTTPIWIDLQRVYAGFTQSLGELPGLFDTAVSCNLVRGCQKRLFHCAANDASCAAALLTALWHDKGLRSIADKGLRSIAGASASVAATGDEDAAAHGSSGCQY